MGATFSGFIKPLFWENITGGGLIADATGTETYSVSRFKGQFGVQWSPISNRRRILTIGATYDIGGDLNPNVTTKVQTGDIFNTVAMDMGNRLGLKLPQQVAVGIYYNTPKIAVGAGLRLSGLAKRQFSVGREIRSRFRCGLPEHEYG